LILSRERGQSRRRGTGGTGEGVWTRAGLRGSVRISQSPGTCNPRKSGRNGNASPGRETALFYKGEGRPKRSVSSGGLLPRQGGEESRVLLAKERPRRVRELRAGDEQHVEGRLQQTFIPSKQLPGAPAGPVPFYGVTDLSTGNRGHPGISQDVRKKYDREVSAPKTPALLVKRRKIRFFSDPLPRSVRIAHSTARRLRPFARRLFMTFRPPAELIRTRKPCAFLRFRLLGLNEGFIVSPSARNKALILNNPGTDVKPDLPFLGPFPGFSMGWPGKRASKLFPEGNSIPGHFPFKTRRSLAD